ncbi:MAG: hypothetical protein U0527_02390 [Candidatus Eisenbacteria bacterium]
MTRRALGWMCLLLLAGSPASAYNLYYGNMHSHCALSDGIGTPDEAFVYARDVANIDVLVLTDHTHLLTASEYSTLLSKATQYSQDGVFLAIGAQEFGNLNDFNHMNIYDAPTRNPVATDDLRHLPVHRFCRARSRRSTTRIRSTGRTSTTWRTTRSTGMRCGRSRW